MGYQNANIAYLSVDKKPVSFMVTGEEQTYAAGESREITIVSDGTRYMSSLTDGGVKISYYRVNENDDTLTPAKKCVEAGRYLYEIQLTDEAAERYDIKNRYVYSAHYAADPKTPNIDEYDNIGFMDFRTAYTAGKNVGTYSVTPYGLSSDKYDISYEPGTITVEPKTLTASDFTVTAENRTYDGSLDANVTAAANVSGIRTVFFDAEEITGAKGANYEFESGTAKIATYIAQINKLKVKIFVSAATNRTYSGDPEYVDVSANAGGKVFTDFTVLYEDENGNAKEPIAPGTYNVKVVLNDETNYETEPYTAQLVIKNASHPSFTIYGIHETVYYGDEFDVSTDSDGDVTYTVTGNAEVEVAGHVKVTGTGKITLEAVSSKEGFADKSVKRTFTANKKVISSEITAENRTYDGTSGVNIDSVQLIGTLPTDSVTASATGAMLNSDAGDNKTVYAKVTLDGNWGEVYALDTESVQTTVDIKKALITGIKITAQDKKYSKTDDALVRVDEITGVLAMDASLVRVSGEAKFDTASTGDNKTVTFIATELTGRKAANYEFESPDAMQAMAEASITPLNVTFTLGALTFGYDTDEKPVTVSAFDETGAVFTDYDIVYRDADGNDLGFVPKDAGSYLVGIEITDSNYVTD